MTNFASDITNLSQSATWYETLAQPDIWRDWAVAFDYQSIRAWVQKQNVTEVWFCGAGTSAFIGDILAAGLEHLRGPYQFRSVASTDLVAQPREFLTDRRPLVVNFGRSGNSSETIGVLDVLDEIAPDAPRLNITCNTDSALATRHSAQTKSIILPSQTHDSGFAMTSSFSTMLYTALMVLGADISPDHHLMQAADCFTDALPQIIPAIGAAPKRAIFLGTGAMTFAAREAALKVMELTAGSIPCLWDSTLGFRHGPKSFVADDSLIVLFNTAQDPAHRYEADLITELRHQYPKSRVITFGPRGDIDLDHPNGPLWAAPNAVLFGQVAGINWAHAMGYNVDNPFVGQNTLTRVVSGVKLYGVSTQ
jgi:tagatose-6-phosphate ketose/aldose isomerase